MAATRNQHHVRARSFGSLPNGSLPTYFAGNQMMQDMRGYELAGLPRRQPRQLGSSLGFIGAGQMDVPLALALASVWIGLDFPGAREGAKAVKKLVNEPIPKIQTGMLFVGTAVIIGRQFKWW